MANRKRDTKNPRTLGQIEIRAGQPLAFVEAANAVVGPKPSQKLQKAASIVGAVFKAYREAAKNLLAERYSEIRELVPSHLKNPCDILVICCENGIIVRYDLGNESALKVRAGAAMGDLTELAPKFSDNLIHFPIDRASYDPGPNLLKLEIKKIKAETGAQEPIRTIPLAVIGSLSFDSAAPVSEPPSRPPCLVSLTNEVQVVIEGVALPAHSNTVGNIDRSREFLAQGAIALQVGWQAFEVYPAFQAKFWKPEFAALWAEADLLAAVARRQLARAQQVTLDPNLYARRHFKTLLDELTRLLDGPEEPAHQFLKKHPEIMSPTHVAAWSKLRLGDHVTDFVFREPTDDYLLVEIESPLRKLFRKDGQQRHELTHAFNQILDWRGFIENNLHKVRDEIGLKGISTNPRSLIVIGRSRSVTLADRVKLVTLQGQIPRLRIITYDELIEATKSMAENLFGPFGSGGTVELLYPPSKPDAS